MFGSHKSYFFIGVEDGKVNIWLPYKTYKYASIESHEHPNNVSYYGMNQHIREKTHVE